VTLGVAAAFFGLWLKERGSDPAAVTSYLRDESAAVTDTATRLIDALMTYDADTIAARRDEIEPLSTESLRAQYEEILSGGLDEALSRTGAAASGEIVTGPDPSFISATRAVASARVLQEVTTDERPEPRTVFYVVRLVLVQQEGEWRVDEFEILAQNSDG
jgi:hypothetical protein